MPDTYTKIYIHIIFTVQGRQNLISKQYKDELHKYITGIIQNKKQKVIAINGMPDHIHILIGIKPDIALSDLIRDVKANSSKFINEKKWIAGKFSWQEGFGGFSYSHSQLESVANYIKNQEKHHTKKTFRDEYLDMLKKFDVEYDPKYIFSWVDDQE
jgi:REP element-mobilizing transposase RayT